MGLARAPAKATVQVPGQVDRGRKRWALREAAAAGKQQQGILHTLLLVMFG